MSDITQSLQEDDLSDGNFMGIDYKTFIPDFRYFIWYLSDLTL